MSKTVRMKLAKKELKKVMSRVLVELGEIDRVAGLAISHGNWDENGLSFKLAANRDMREGVEKTAIDFFKNKRLKCDGFVIWHNSEDDIIAGVARFAGDYIVINGSIEDGKTISFYENIDINMAWSILENSCGENKVGRKAS